MVGKRQRRRVTAHDGDARSFVPLCKLGHKRRIVLETRHPARASQQLVRGCARPGPDFQNVVAERVPGKNPRKQFSLGDKTPNRGAAKPVLEFVHERPDWRGYTMLDAERRRGKQINLM